MHEMALMGEIIRLIESDAKEREIKKVEKVELVVGDLSNALPDALQMAFEFYKLQELDFLDSNVTLLIIREKAKAKCISCDLEYEPDFRIAICPICDAPSGKLIAGESFAIKSYTGI